MFLFVFVGSARTVVQYSTIHYKTRQYNTTSYTAVQQHKRVECCRDRLDLFVPMDGPRFEKLMTSRLFVDVNGQYWECLFIIGTDIHHGG